MESSPSSRISFFTTAGLLLQSPIDGLDCGISVDIPRDSEQVASLKLGTRELPIWFIENSLCALSAWPACGPGQYTLSLECGDIQEQQIITVLPRHFTEKQVNQILHDLTETLPNSIASSLQQCGGLKGKSVQANQEPSVEQQYLRLTKAIRGSKERLGILQILPMIQRDCYQVLVARHELRATNRARRPDISKLPQVISMPGNVGPGGYLYQLYDQTVERSYETYENRLVKAYVQALQSQLLRLLARLEEEQVSPTAAKNIQDLFADFHLTCSRTAFLKQVRLPFVSAGRITMVLLKKPSYRAVLEDYLALYKQTPIRLEEPKINDSINEFPYLYQLWANLKVVKVLLQVGKDLGYRCINHNWVKSDDKGIYFEPMKDYSTAIDLSSPKTGKMVKLIPWTPETGQKETNYGHDLPPALTICVYATGKPPVVLVFDPKYKVAASQDTSTASQTLSAEIQADRDEAANLSSILPMPEHLDELRCAMKAVKTPAGVREIQYAAILYPGLSRQIAPGLEAISARPHDEQDTDEMENGIAKLLRKYLT